MENERDSTDVRWMRLALRMGEKAAQQGEVPVGAVVIRENVVIGLGRNQPRFDSDPCAHAEVVALRDASARTFNYRLVGATVYSTLEPCAMCAGALLAARVRRVVFGAKDPKSGAAGSVMNVFTDPVLNHHTTITAGVLGSECAELLQTFFAERRAMKERRGRVRMDAIR